MDMTWKRAVANAEHLRALGITEVYLGHAEDDPDIDWKACTEVRAGGSHRLDIITSLWFYFQDLGSGLTFRLSLDLDKSEADGKPYYQIEVERIVSVLRRLKPDSRPYLQLVGHLAETAAAVEKNAREFQETAAREFGVAYALREAARLGTPSLTPEDHR